MSTKENFPFMLIPNNELLPKDVVLKLVLYITKPDDNDDVDDDSDDDCPTAIHQIQSLPVPSGITAKDVGRDGAVNLNHPEILKLKKESPFCTGNLADEEITYAVVRMKDPSLQHLLSNAVAFFLRKKPTKGGHK